MNNHHNNNNNTAATTTSSTSALNRLGAVALAAALVAASACGSDDDSATAATPTDSIGQHDDRSGDPRVVTIEGVDYGFNGVPSSVPAGSVLAFRNSAPAELHELVAFRLADDDDIAIDDLVRLPVDELGPRVGAPVAVLLQAPGSDEQIPAVGDGTLAEPGRYVFMCFIPTGADPQEYLAAAAAAEGEAPTDVAGGPPHFVNGMYAEVVVEG